MKKLFVLMTFLLVPLAWFAAPSTALILGDDATSGDSVGVSIVLTDSLNNPIAPADTFILYVVGPSADTVKYLTGGPGTAGLNIDSVSLGFMGKMYLFADAVTELVPVGLRRPGAYELNVCAKMNSPLYVNCAKSEFNLVDTALDKHFAELLEVLDSLKNQATLGQVAMSVVDSMIAWGFVRYDSAQAVLQIAGLWIRSLTTDSAGMIVVGSGDGSGMKVFGGSGNSQGGHFQGFGDQNGILAQAATTGHGFRAQGGATSGYGGFLEGRGGNSDGLVCKPAGTGAGLYPTDRFIDSLRSESGFRNNLFSRTFWHADVDTLLIINMAGPDTLYYRVYFHVGGSPGDSPDSTKTYQGAP